MHLVIERIDPSDESVLTAAHRTFFTAESYGRPHSDAMSRPVFETNLRTTDGADPWRGWIARVDGVAVGVALLRWPTHDNVHVCWGWVSVLPEYRRRGYGSRLLETLTAAGRELGRTTLELDAITPVDAVDPGNHAFLASHGLAPVMHEVRYALALPVPDARLDELAADLREPLPYTIETWRDAVSAERSEAFRAILGRVETESPHGDRDVEPEVWTEERLRAEDERRRVAGWTMWTTAAFTADGECAGFTELCVRDGSDGTARQSGTLVAPGHRGHRLGLAVKLANLRALQAAHTELAAITTYTSPRNAYMRSVNDDLGFRPIETLDLWSLDLTRG